MQPYQFTAAEAARLIRDRRLSCEELVRSCLDRIAAREPVVKAWLFLDPDLAIRRARELDKRAVQDGPRGPLHGLPFGVKDVIDTLDMPTTQNSPIYEAARIGRDAACVGVVRHSGALILGKTDTVEFASGGRKALTRNPFNPMHTPGGSSSGSGAAVGDFMVPLAFGTQTAGSHIRPASFNNIYALKPSWSLVSREGVRMAALSLDTVGWFGRSVEDLRLVAEAFRLPGLAQPAASLKGLRVGLCRSPVWNRIEPAGAAALETAARRLEAAGAIVEPLELPAHFAGLTAAREVIGRHEGSAAFLPEYLAAHHLLAADLRQRVELRATYDSAGLLAAYALADRCRPEFDALFGPRLDVVLTPAAPGEAPEGLHTTGDWIFNGIWTLLHVPCLAIPAIRGPRGLPVGIQLVGPRLSDARLLAIAAACAPAIDSEPGWARETLCR
ncbi:amidase [Paracraurococcus lichenis]|uniref:Amidase n=1 Tax=Paracraurococcus lichenis TaxID=3064888 RepID=A0ABT9EC05_9PROT|nr:amidase [Paracraurococcus sp. LOR1-02]MDO9713430.1 amidase [Paracraurococcus sp. LOR1-02]